MMCTTLALPVCAWRFGRGGASLVRNVPVARESRYASLLFGGGGSFVRSYRTQAIDLSHKVNRVSVQEPRAGELITAIRNHSYARAAHLVRSEGVLVDGHAANENTPLTDAAKRGDVAGITFLIRELRANPHASCDCPRHRTACHYAAKYAQTEAMRTLLELGAKPNVHDANGNTAMDYAAPGFFEINSGNPSEFDKVRAVLKQYGGKTSHAIEVEEQEMLRVARTNMFLQESSGPQQRRVVGGKEGSNHQVVSSSKQRIGFEANSKGASTTRKRDNASCQSSSSGTHSYYTFNDDGCDGDDD